MCLYKILHDTRVKKKSGLVLKLDFKKAYNKVNWEFLFKYLEQRGFTEKWCHWMKVVVVLSV